MSCDIELEVSPGAIGDEFTVRVLRAVAGTRSTAAMHLNLRALLDDCETLEETVLASTVTARRLLSPGEKRLRAVGEELFQALFAGNVEETYRSSALMATDHNESLRVVLRLNAPELATLPWEAMYDGETDEYICRSEPLVRHVEAPYVPALKVTAPLRVLGVVASPRGMPQLDVERERERLMAALRRPIDDGLAEVEWLMGATWETLHDTLLSGEWHVLHFSGHGDYDMGDDQGVIALVGADGGPHKVGADRLADLLREARPTPRLVVLNSCATGRTGSRDMFSSSAATLVRRGVGAVIAMQFTVSDDGAIAFSRGFYSALAEGRSIDESARSGRVGMLRADSLEWVTPVLYVRGDTAQLFDLKSKRKWRGNDRDEGIPKEDGGESEVSSAGGGQTDTVKSRSGLLQETARLRGLSLRKRALLIGSALALALIAAASAVIVFNRGDIRYSGVLLKNLDVHTEPHSLSDRVSTLPHQMRVYIVCHTNGEEIEGFVHQGELQVTDIWNKISTEPDGDALGYVPDAFVDTGGLEARGPLC